MKTIAPVASMRWLMAVLAVWLVVPAAWAAEGGNLVSVQWLEKNRERPDVLLIDASVSKLYAAKHIPGAIGVDLYTYGAPHKTPPAQMEGRIQSWGVSAGKHVVIYDEGASMMATWLFYELYYHGFPAENLSILDGGLAKWEATGGAVTKDPTPAPAKGTFRVASTVESARVRLADFVAASGDPQHFALVEALEPAHHFGEMKFFDRAGHVPNAIMLPAPDFYNADKTFKSPGEIRRMAAYLGIKPDQQVLSHCGGGVAATVPFFALKFLSGYRDVKVYQESQMEWLRDERGLPFWTYDAPGIRRDMNWVQSWGNRMMRMYGVAQMSVIDVRGSEAYKANHVPFAISIPAETFRANAADPAKLAALLGPAGVDPATEAVIVSDGGLNPDSALAFAMLERAGQKKVSVMMDSVDEWGMHGFPLTKDAVAKPAAYQVPARDGVIVTEVRGEDAYPKVFVASGKAMPARVPEGRVIHVAYTDLLDANGAPKAAADLWKILAKAGVPRYAEVVTFADDPGEAAVNYYVLKLMGWPDVKLLLR